MLAVTVNASLVRTELERPLERFEQPLGDQLGARRQRELLGDHDELVAAEAAERVGVAHTPSSLAATAATAHRRRRGRACR
jgi:ABC-type phosphate/phosphonate transport system substrate-binding protein